MSNHNDLQLPLHLFRRGAEDSAEVRRVSWLVHLVPTSPQFNPDAIRAALKKGRSITLTTESQMRISIKGDVRHAYIGYEDDRCVLFDAEIIGFAIIGTLDVPDTLTIPRFWLEEGHVQLTGGARYQL